MTSHHIVRAAVGTAFLFFLSACGNGSEPQKRQEMPILSDAGSTGSENLVSTDETYGNASGDGSRGTAVAGKALSANAGCRAYPHRSMTPSSYSGAISYLFQYYLRRYPTKGGQIFWSDQFAGDRGCSDKLDAVLKSVEEYVEYIPWDASYRTCQQHCSRKVNRFGRKGKCVSIGSGYTAMNGKVRFARGSAGAANFQARDLLAVSCNSFDSCFTQEAQIRNHQCNNVLLGRIVGSGAGAYCRCQF